MIINLLAWLLFGAIAGWVASILMKTDAQQGMVGNIVIGIVGAIAGGYVARLLGGSGVTGFNLRSLLVAILGAVALLCVVKLVTHRT